MYEWICPECGKRITNKMKNYLNGGVTMHLKKHKKEKEKVK